MKTVIAVVILLVTFLAVVPAHGASVNTYTISPSATELTFSKELVKRTESKKSNELNAIDQINAVGFWVFMLMFFPFITFVFLVILI